MSWHKPLPCHRRDASFSVPPSMKMRVTWLGSKPLMRSDLGCPMRQNQLKVDCKLQISHPCGTKVKAAAWHQCDSCTTAQSCCISVPAAYSQPGGAHQHHHNLPLTLSLVVPIALLIVSQVVSEFPRAAISTYIGSQRIPDFCTESPSL